MTLLPVFVAGLLLGILAYSNATQLNVLFLMVEDLRPEFNQAYGQDNLVTPNLDRFTKTSLTFDRAYVQYSHCSPSRNSFMSGRSPQVTGVYNFLDDFREKGKIMVLMLSKSLVQ